MLEGMICKIERYVAVLKCDRRRHFFIFLLQALERNSGHMSHVISNVCRRRGRGLAVCSCIRKHDVKGIAV